MTHGRQEVRIAGHPVWLLDVSELVRPPCRPPLSVLHLVSGPFVVHTGRVFK